MLVEFLNISSNEGMILDMVICSIIVCAGFPYLKSSKARKYYSTGLSILLSYWYFGWSGCIHTFITTLVVYLFCVMFDRTMALKLSWIWSLLYLSVCNILSSRQRLDFCLIQMMLTCKVTSFVSDYEDKKIGELVEFSDVLNYVYFFPGYFIGPFTEYNETIKFLNNEHLNFEPNKVCPSYEKVLVQRLKESAVILIFLLYLRQQFPLAKIFEPSFLEMSILSRLVYVYFGILGFRLGYEFIWTFSNISFIVSEYAYNGRDDITFEPKFDRGLSMDLKFEFSTSSAEMTSRWNKQTGYWLKKYCYQRLTFMSKNMAMICTQILSAFWHGFAIGYPLSFLIGGLNILISRIWYKKFPKRSDLLYKVMMIISLNLAFSYSMIPFIFLKGSIIFEVFAKIWFIPLIINILSYIIIRKI